MTWRCAPDQTGATLPLPEECSERNHIGEVDHLIIDKLSGRVAYAVISFGGFMGLGNSHYPIPWNALSYDTSLGGFKTTEKQLTDMPQFRAHQYYRARPYWEATT